jgi:hypothetical protein
MGMRNVPIWMLRMGMRSLYGEGGMKHIYQEKNILSAKDLIIKNYHNVGLYGNS